MALGTLQHFTVVAPKTNTRIRAAIISAFAATDVDGVRTRLKSKNLPFREKIVPRTGDNLALLCDPDGVGVELNFPKPRALRRQELGDSGVGAIAFDFLACVSF